MTTLPLLRQCRQGLWPRKHTARRRNPHPTPNRKNEGKKKKLFGLPAYTYSI